MARQISATPLVLRPPPMTRGGAWGMVAFAVVFGLAGIFGDDPDADDRVGGLLMVVFAVLMLLVSIALITARAKITPSGIRYRYGIIRRNVPASDTVSVTVGPGSGAYYSRICVHVIRLGKSRPIRLTALQHPDTAKRRGLLEQDAASARQILGIE